MRISIAWFCKQCHSGMWYTLWRYYFNFYISLLVNKSWTSNGTEIELWLLSRATQPFLGLRGKPSTNLSISTLLALDKARSATDRGRTRWDGVVFFSTGNQDSEMVAHALRRLFDPLQDWVLRLIRTIGVSAAAGGIACIYVYISHTLLRMVYTNW